MFSDPWKYVSSDPLDYYCLPLPLPQKIIHTNFDSPQNFSSSKLSSPRACDWILVKEHYGNKVRIVGDWSV